MDYEEFLNLPTKITIRRGNKTEELVYNNTASHLFGNYMGFLFQLDGFSNVFHSNNGIHNIIGYLKSLYLLEQAKYQFKTEEEHYTNLVNRFKKNLFDRQIEIEEYTKESIINKLFGNDAFNCYNNLIACGEDPYKDRFWNILTEAIKNKDNKVLDDVDFT